MTRRPLSIRARFLIVSLVTVPSALTLAALFMVSVFSASLERRLDLELTGHVNTIAASLNFATDGQFERPIGFLDRRSTEAYGGLYWQIGDETSPARFRSQSLWDYTLSLPADLPAGGGIHRLDIPGPNGSVLMAQQRRIEIMTPTGLRKLQVVVAVDRKPLEEASMAFAMDIFPYLAGLAAFLIGASVIQVVFGLKPLAALTEGLDRIRERRGGRLDGVLPAEFAPVETAVNRLLDTQAQSLAKARARAGDLAHGLKTPLTVLSNDALTLRGKGETEMADEIERLVRLMRGHVDAELARSRIVTNPEMRQSDAVVAKVVDQVVRTLQRTPKCERLTWRLEIGEPRTMPLDPHDLRELVGNIVENAVKWAAEGIEVRWQDRQLVVTDDGPGVDPGKIGRMTERGVRLDTSVEGTGFGLSIVREICAVYGLTLAIENAQAGGLRVCVTFGPPA
jgi:signal transduction histidine kinase